MVLRCKQKPADVQVQSSTCAPANKFNQLYQQAILKKSNQTLLKFLREIAGCK